MDYSDIRFEQDEGVAVITLDRPDQMNTFTGAMGRELSHAYRRCDEEDAVRAVVLTGAGRAFCAGADMTGGEETFANQEGMADFDATPVRPVAFEIRKPVIAAMNGHAVGLGLTLALHCDMRIAALEGKYGILQVRRGVMPDARAHWTLPRIVGYERAASLLLTGRKIDGAEAAEIGMVLRALPAAEVLPAALEIARDIAVNTAPLSVAISKKLLWQGADLSAEEVGEMETALHHVLMGAPDSIEGPMAFLERRVPRFQSRLATDWPEWPQPKKRG